MSVVLLVFGFLSTGGGVKMMSLMRSIVDTANSNSLEAKRLMEDSAGTVTEVCHRGKESIEADLKDASWKWFSTGGDDHG